MSDRIENVTDQMELYVHEVRNVIENLVKHYDYTIDQAIKIVELGIKDMSVEVVHHNGEDLHTIAYDYGRKVSKEDELIDAVIDNLE